MRRSCGWLLGVLAALLLAAPAALAHEGNGEEAPKAKKRAEAKAEKKRPAKKDEYAVMAEVLGLEGEAKAQFEEQVAKGQAAIAEKENAILAEMKLLQTSRAALRKEMNAKIVAGLTDEQKSKWAGYQLRVQVLGRYRQSKLTDEQTAKIQTMCEAAAKEIGDGEDLKVRSVAMRKLHGEIVKNVLDEEQRKPFVRKRGADRKPAKAKEKKAEGEGEKAE
ncbi:MAG: hypothetical protein ABIF82_15460 [Planctomycetota bacterium]